MSNLKATVDRAVSHWTAAEDRIRYAQNDNDGVPVNVLQATLAVAESLQGILAIMLAQNGVDL